MDQSVGAVIDGMPSGVKIDYELMADMMNAAPSSGCYLNRPKRR
jgi:chorismate synthase